MSLTIAKVLMMAAAAVVWFVLAANEAGTGWPFVDVALGVLLVFWAVGDLRKAMRRTPRAARGRATPPPIPAAALPPAPPPRSAMGAGPPPLPKLAASHEDAFWRETLESGAGPDQPPSLPHEPDGPDESTTPRG
jgi:hypothetical protein